MRTGTAVRCVSAALVGAGRLAADAYVVTSSSMASTASSSKAEFWEQRSPTLLNRLDALANRLSSCQDDLIDIVESVRHDCGKYLDAETKEIFDSAVIAFARSAPREIPRRRRGRPLRDGAKDAIRKLYLCDVPDPKEIPNSRLCREVADLLKKKKISISNDTILRAAGRRQ